MSLRDELQTLYRENGYLTPQVVVEAAIPSNHPLHGRFEWDDTVAGPLYRLDQARELIRSFTVKYRRPDSEMEETVRFYHSVRTDSGQVYHSLDDIQQSDFLQKLTLMEAERRWRELYAQYAHLSDFLNLVRKDIAV